MKVKKISLLILTLLLLICLSFSIVLTVGKADQITLSNIDVKQEYSFGETITIPDATLTVNGTEYNTKKFLVLPSGELKTGDSYLLTENGNYAILYKTEVDGKVVEKTVPFTVLSDLFGVSSLNSSANYGTNEYLPEDVEGVNVSLVDGDVFTYNQVIDVSNFNKGVNIIKFYVTPKTIDEPEFSLMKITLTDIYDPNNTVTLRYNCLVSEKTWSWNYMYAQVAANSQDFVGLEYTPDRTNTTLYNGRYFALHRNNQFGFCSYASYTGVPRGEFIDNYQYFALDYSSKKVYVKHSYFNSWPDSNMVTDLDDSILYGNNLWEGFTTGEVLLSVNFEGYSAASANIFITEVAGRKAETYSFKDNVAPKLNIDFGDYSAQSCPKAFVDSPYKVLDAIAFDNLEGEVEVKTQVYYNYYSENRVNIELKNGCFTPKYIGKYTVEYIATDKDGNQSSALLDIDCYVANEIMTIEVESSANQSSIVAKQVFVNSFSVERNNGKVDVEIYAQLKSDNTVKYQIDCEELVFVPYYTGIYEIVYVAKDYTHTAIDSYEVEILAVDKPIIVGKTDLPPYLIKGAKYSFENLKAYYFTDGGRLDIDAKCFVVEDGANEKEVNGTYLVTASNSVDVIYRATGGDGTAEQKMGTIPVVDVSYDNPYSLKVDKYFQNNGFVSDIKLDGIQYTKEQSNEQVEEFDFINKVYVKEFSLIFAFVENYTDFETFELLLTDLTDSSNVLKFEFILLDGKVTVRVNGNNDRAFTFDYTAGEDISLYYNALDNIVQINGTFSLDLDSVAGLFAGFSGNYVKLDLDFINTNGKVGIRLYKLLNQFLMKGVYDTVKPDIIIGAKDASVKKINSKITIKKNDYFDLFDPSVFVSLSITSPSEEYVSSVDNVVLNKVSEVDRDYEIILDEFGIYTVTYLVYDATGNLREYSYIYTVKDTDAPVIELENGYKTNVKKGDSVKIAELIVGEDLVNVSVSVMIIRPDGITELLESNKFTASQKGTYNVYYFVFDAEMNSSIISYTITVS